VRLVELVGTLSMAADAAAGMADHHALRGAIVGARLARLLAVDAATRTQAYYLPLLAMSGCTAEAHLSAGAFGDEVAIGVESYGLDWGRPSEMLPVVLRLVSRGRGRIGGAVAVVRAFANLSQALEIGRAHCEVAAHLAERFGFDEAFRAALFQAFERWDGSGRPSHLEGESIALGMRIAHVAIDANIGHRLGGVDGAVTLVKKHARRGLDPGVVERFVGAAAEVCSALETVSPWAAALDAEPEPYRMLDVSEGDARRAPRHAQADDRAGSDLPVRRCPQSRRPQVGRRLLAPHPRVACRNRRHLSRSPGSRLSRRRAGGARGSGASPAPAPRRVGASRRSPLLARAASALVAREARR
jgi:hypothetical protein